MAKSSRHLKRRIKRRNKIRSERTYPGNYVRFSTMSFQNIPMEINVLERDKDGVIQKKNIQKWVANKKTVSHYYLRKWNKRA